MAAQLPYGQVEFIHVQAESAQFLTKQPLFATKFVLILFIVLFIIPKNVKAYSCSGVILCTE